MAEDYDGDFEAEQYRGYLRYLAENQSLKMIGGEFDASDAVQETLLKAHQFRHQYNGQSASEYKSWLRSILANVIAGVFRRLGTKKRNIRLIERSIQETVNKSGRQLEDFLEGLGSSPSSRASKNEALRLLLAAIEALPTDQREALTLHHLRQMSVTEVSTEMGRSEASIAGLLRRAMHTLRQVLDSEKDTGCD